MSVITIGHVKTKDVSDVVSGESYQILTSDQQQNYFNALKKNLHFLGLAYIDRNIVKEKTGKKNAITKKDEVVNKISEETRKIKFRDDSYAVDSGSRFANIVPEINLDADEFIEALKNAILAEQSKSGIPVKEAEKKQNELASSMEKKVAEKEKAALKKNELDNIVNDIVAWVVANRTDIPVISKVLDACKSKGYANPKEITDLDDAKEILALIE